MAKVKVSEYDSTAASNTDVASINIAEGCSPANINNAIRAVMGHLKDFQAGNVAGNALAVASGGTGAETASAARTNLGLGALATVATVDTAQIADDAITTVKILDANVTSAKLATNAVTTVKITDANVTTAKIADDAITSAKILNNNVTADELNVSGNGTAGQALLSDGDGSFSWGDGGITKTTGSPAYYGNRAWINFNGTGTPSISASSNFSSITDEGTGKYRLNFTTAMPDANYAISGAAQKNDANDDGNTHVGLGNGTAVQNASYCYIRTNNGGGLVDSANISVIIAR